MWHWRGKASGIEQDFRLVQEELRVVQAQLAEFRDICRKAGVEVSSAAADAVPGVPAHLIAAARTRSSEPYPVMLTGTDGMQPAAAIAVVGGGGDPALWWDSVRRAIPPARHGATGLRHAFLADGLHAVAVPGAAAATITVSSALDAPGRRAAVRTAVRAARRAGWLPSRVPVFLLPALAALRPAAKVATAKGAAAAISGAAVIAGGVGTVVFVNGHFNTSSGAADYDAPALVHHAGRDYDGSLRLLPAYRHKRPARYPLITQPPPSILALGPGASRMPHRGGSSPAPSSPTPAPSGTTGSPSPTPSPTTSSPAPVTSAGACVVILGVKVCLGV